MEHIMRIRHGQHNTELRHIIEHHKERKKKTMSKPDTTKTHEGELVSYVHLHAHPFYDLILILIFGVLTPLSAIFQLYHGDPF